MGLFDRKEESGEYAADTISDGLGERGKEKACGER